MGSSSTPMAAVKAAKSMICTRQRSVARYSLISLPSRRKPPWGGRLNRPVSCWLILGAANSGVASMHLIVEQNRSANIAPSCCRPIPWQRRTIVDTRLIEIHLRCMTKSLEFFRRGAFLLSSIELPHPEGNEQRRNTQSNRQ